MGHFQCILDFLKKWNSPIRLLSLKIRLIFFLKERRVKMNLPLKKELFTNFLAYFVTKNAFESVVSRQRLEAQNEFFFAKFCAKFLFWTFLILKKAKNSSFTGWHSKKFTSRCRSILAGKPTHRATLAFALPPLSLKPLYT